MHYLNIPEIRYIQTDHTSQCNLRCPQCARNHDGDTHPTLPDDELSVDDYRAMVTPVAATLETLMFCGNYGEVIVSKTFMPTVEWLLTGFSGKIIVTTNGSARDEAWWRELARLLQGRGKVNFSIDGLADTNSLYRVNSNFEKIMANARAFIDAGGHARWDYLVFAHNEHQVEEAREIARSSGFRQFQVKLTNRFINDQQYRSGEEATAMPVRTRRSDYMLGMAKDLRFQASGVEQNKAILARYGSWTDYVNATPITCKWKPNGQIFLDFEARVWACTWTASGIHHHGDDNTQKQQARKILDHYGEHFNSLRHHSLADILTHPYFANDFCRSWDGTMYDPIPKLLACGRTCGSGYEFSSAHGSNTKLFTFEDDHADRR
jgi:sulfatase maturation enzyme AslB (radical SAM superfamily)